MIMQIPQSLTTAAKNAVLDMESLRSLFSRSEGIDRDRVAGVWQQIEFSEQRIRELFIAAGENNDQVLPSSATIEIHPTTDESNIPTAAEIKQGIERTTASLNLLKQEIGSFTAMNPQERERGWYLAEHLAKQVSDYAVLVPA